MNIEALGYSSESIQRTVNWVNTLLRPTKQKMAREETKILCFFLMWLCFSFTGAFLSSFYFHFAWAFLFAILFTIGSVLFYKWFKRTQNQDL